MSAAEDTRADERRRMVDDIRAAFARVAPLVPEARFEHVPEARFQHVPETRFQHVPETRFQHDVAPVPDPRVLAAMSEVPRHLFVPEERAGSAYRDRPLPIGQGQTISQPFIVALMTQLLEIGPDARVLEIGTGSGYQAAVLSRLAARVYSIEIVAPLARQAAAALKRYGVENVVTRIGDGYGGWPSEAPFDAIIVTAAPDHVPPALVAQLAPGGRLVIPVGSDEQNLLVIAKAADGATQTRTVVPVRFVPLTRGR